MSRLQKGVPVVFLLFMSVSLNAQLHYNTWFRSTLRTPLGKKVSIDAELQHRRQNGAQNSNMFDKPLMFTFRNWIHYKRGEDVKISISPFAYFSHYKIIFHQLDELANPGMEIRFAAAAEIQQQLFKRSSVVLKNGLEYRVFYKTPARVTRGRIRVGFHYDFSNLFKMEVFDEFLFNITSTSTRHFADHNRTGLTIECMVSSNLELDLGYIRVKRFQVNNMELFENTVFFNFLYKL